jgi:modification methylase
VGIERDHHYAEIAMRRLERTVEMPEAEVLELRPKREAPRIPFGLVVERGLLSPGSLLFDQRRAFVARVTSDGNLVGENHLGRHRGSIHQVGAAMQGLPACNGWTFWHYEDQGFPRPIDMLRQQLRAEIH